MSKYLKSKIWLLGLALAFSSPAARSGVPLTNLQGVGGVAFNPLAYPGGRYPTEDATPEKDKDGKEIKKDSSISDVFSRPQVGVWYTHLGKTDIDWGTAGINETLFKRLELSYGYEQIKLPNSNIEKNNFGAKFLLLEENYGGQKWVPAISVGTIWKTTDASLPVPKSTGSGYDAYLVASKLITQTPRPILLSGGLLWTDEIVTGVMGHDQDRDLTWFGNVDVLPFDFLAVGLEYKQGARYSDVNNANYWDAHVAWFVNSQLTLVAAYVNAGDDKSTRSVGLGDGFVLSAQYQF